MDKKEKSIKSPFFGTHKLLCLSHRHARNKTLSLTVNKAKNGSHPSKFKGLGPFIFLRENRNVFKSA